jgi:hypothetical protein
MAFIAPLIPALSIAGAGLSEVGTLAASASTAANARYQAQVAANNAKIATQDATYATAAGQEQAAQQSLKQANTFGAIKTAQAANGVDVNTGSNENVQESQRQAGALDSATILNNAQNVAYGYRTQSSNDVAQAGAFSAEATGADIAGPLSATGSLLSNASSISTKWLTGTGLGGTSAGVTSGGDFFSSGGIGME